MIRPILVAVALVALGAIRAEAQVAGFPAFGQGPQGPAANQFPGPGTNLPAVSSTLPAQAAPQAPSGQEPEIRFFEPGKLVAQVGDQPVFYGEILGDLNQVVENEMPDASPAIKEARRKQLFMQLLPRIVEQKMVYVDFLKTTPKVDERLPEILDRLEGNFYQSEMPKLMERLKVEDQRSLEEKLRAAGTSLRNIKEAWYESQIVSFHLGSRFTDNKEVTHQEMLDYYRDNQAKFSFPARVRWEELMVRFDNFADPAQARRALEEMGNEVVFGAPLDAVARRRSQGPTAGLGGIREWTKEEDIVDPVLKRVLFTVRVGYLSDIVESTDGLRIVRVLEREAASTKPFRDVQNEITEQIRMDRRKAVVEEYLEQLKERVPVWTILDEEATSGRSSSPATASPFPGSGSFPGRVR